MANQLYGQEAIKDQYCNHDKEMLKETFHY